MTESKKSANHLFLESGKVKHEQNKKEQSREQYLSEYLQSFINDNAAINCQT